MADLPPTKGGSEDRVERETALQRHGVEPPTKESGGTTQVIKVYFRDGAWEVPKGCEFVQIVGTGTDYLGEYHLMLVERPE